jgi:hypothetical protein
MNLLSLNHHVLHHCCIMCQCCAGSGAAMTSKAVQGTTTSCPSPSQPSLAPLSLPLTHSLTHSLAHSLAHQLHLTHSPTHLLHLPQIWFSDESCELPTNSSSICIRQYKGARRGSTQSQYATVHAIVPASRCKRVLENLQDRQERA